MRRTDRAWQVDLLGNRIPVTTTAQLAAVVFGLSDVASPSAAAAPLLLALADRAERGETFGSLEALAVALAELVEQQVSGDIPGH